MPRAVLPPSIVQPEAWLRHLFSAKAAIDGGVVRRKSSDMERIVGRTRFEAELRRRGFRAVENEGQIVIFCNRGALRLIE
ncbi:N-(5'-phosphoribosyl)anthranilate isomerase [Jannaschia sp. M317]|uniref:N-(5'-phosphoribosyl)anthranilate isomerase n=1 Tax=Jannaschia sp. M317 TaxID=2867011 RepID=UPI0021A4099B|nr:N-(5'-phosphoribosyl)anthranilate isomerase [Jannaschia sp. M317]UWQ18546.1 N-(5'-phosphoribosyl)anthranilate isomerase [Jannaschia sp. M317]